MPIDTNVAPKSSQRVNFVVAQRLPKDLDENVLKNVIGKVQYVAVEIIAKIRAFFSTLKSWLYGPQFTKKGFDATVAFRKNEKVDFVKSTLFYRYIENAVLQIQKNAFDAIEDNSSLKLEPKKINKDSIAYKICESVVSQDKVYKISALLKRAKSPYVRYFILLTAKDLKTSKEIKSFLEAEFEKAKKEILKFIEHRKTSQDRANRYAKENALETNEVLVEEIPEETVSQSIGLDEGVILDYATDAKEASVDNQAANADKPLVVVEIAEESQSVDTILLEGTQDITTPQESKTSSNPNIEEGKNQPLNSRKVSWQNTAYTVAVGLVAAYTLYSWYQSYTTSVDDKYSSGLAGSGDGMWIDDFNSGNTSPAFEFPLQVDDITSFVVQNVTTPIVNSTKEVVSTIADNTCEVPVQLVTAISTYVRNVLPQCVMNTSCHMSEAPIQTAQSVVSNVAQNTTEIADFAYNIGEKVIADTCSLVTDTCALFEEGPKVVTETVREIAQSASDPIIDAGDAIIRWSFQKIASVANLCIEAMATD
ncbi:MAG: hypothetical protein KR126chlam6_00287 [Candidatus Anoxychlamydiales bacterium]|nr:hypothetical protein [Candidatus Anoxychlamydiales bacterium]